MVLTPSSPSAGATDENFHWLDREEERRVFDEQVRAILGISGEEFPRRLDAGLYDDVLDDTGHSDLMYLALLSALAR